MTLGYAGGTLAVSCDILFFWTVEPLCPKWSCAHNKKLHHFRRQCWGSNPTSNTRPPQGTKKSWIEAKRPLLCACESHHRMHTNYIERIYTCEFRSALVPHHSIDISPGGTSHPLKTTSIELRCKAGWNILSWLGARGVALCILREPVLPWIFQGCRLKLETELNLQNWFDDICWWMASELGCHSFVTLRGSKQCGGSILEWPWSARIFLGRSLHMYRIRLRKTI